MKYTTLALAVSVLALPTALTADVKSLTSDELTETYIRDTTIIVTPKSKPEEEKKKRERVTLTISPGEEAVEEHEEQAEFGRITDATGSSIEGAIANAEDKVRESSLRTQTLQTEALAAQVPNIAFLPNQNFPAGLQIPEGDFSYNFVGNELGLSRTEDQLTFSIGNLPGINTIKVPYAIDEGGPATLIPRPGGGFDLTIDIPKN